MPTGTKSAFGYKKGDGGVACQMVCCCSDCQVAKGMRKSNESVHSRTATDGKSVILEEVGFVFGGGFLEFFFFFYSCLKD